MGMSTTEAAHGDTPTDTSSPTPGRSGEFDTSAQRATATFAISEDDLEDDLEALATREAGLHSTTSAAASSTLKLIAAIDALRCVIADSTLKPLSSGAVRCSGGAGGGCTATAASQGPSRASRHQNAAEKKPVPGFSIPGQEFGQGQRTSDVPMKLTKAMSLKDDRLKIRKEKVSAPYPNPI